jgi:hypothetical protein
MKTLKPTEDASLAALAVAVQELHGGTARFAESVPVIERFDGKLVWDGIVHVFDLAGHSSAKRAYAWSSPIDGSDKRRFFAVLHIPPIDSPLAAVRAAIVTEHQANGR